MTANAPRRWPAWLSNLPALLALPVALWMGFEAQRSFRADWLSIQARQQVVDWLAETSPVFSEEAWQEASRALQSSLALTPDDPTLHERLGDLYSVAGRRDWDNAQLRQTHFNAAAEKYEAALALRAGEPGAWAALASARQSSGSSPASVHMAWSKAQALGPFEGHVQPVLLQVVLADWDGASPAMQNWARALFDHSDTATRTQINALAKYYGLIFMADANER